MLGDKCDSGIVMSNVDHTISEKTVTTAKKNPLILTQATIVRLMDLINRKIAQHTESNEQDLVDELLGVRLSVKQQGCSGYKYDLSYAYDLRPFEHVIDIAGKFKFIVDPKALMYVIGTTVDYLEEKFSAEFIFINPNEKGRCGCGESFNV